MLKRLFISTILITITSFSAMAVGKNFNVSGDLGFTRGSQKELNDNDSIPYGLQAKLALEKSMFPLLPFSYGLFINFDRQQAKILNDNIENQMNRKIFTYGLLFNYDINKMFTLNFRYGMAKFSDTLETSINETTDKAISNLYKLRNERTAVLSYGLQFNLSYFGILSRTYVNLIRTEYKKFDSSQMTFSLGFTFEM